MVKLYFKYGRELENISDSNVIELIEKYRHSGCDAYRVRVIVEDENYKSPTVQLAGYEFEHDEPWKSDWWLLGETTWGGKFVPDDSWETVVLEA